METELKDLSVMRPNFSINKKNANKQQTPWKTIFYMFLPEMGKCSVIKNVSTTIRLPGLGSQVSSSWALPSLRYHSYNRLQED